MQNLLENRLPFTRIFHWRSLILIPLLSGIVVACSNCSSTTKKPLPARKDSTVNLPPPSTLSDAEKNQLNAACEIWFDSLLGRTNFNGAVLVAKSGNIVFEKFKGTAHVGSSDAITGTTQFHIASVSKTITAMSILKLWQEGKLNIDDEFSKYFPAFNYPGVTIRTLLNHRSGLPNYVYFMEDLGWDKHVYIKNQDILDWLINHKAELKNIGAPGKHFTYCNTNYALLALLAEKITNTPFPEYIQQAFFKPLGMTHSFIFTRADSATINPSYDWRGQLIPLNYLDLVYGDKNVFSTPEDLLLWDRALRSNLLFSKETLEQAYTPYSNEKKGVRNYGLGWRMNIYPNGKKLIYHNGWWHGYNASFIRLIDEDATIIVLGNQYNRTIYKAKSLAPLFGAKYITGEEEEGENNKADSISAGADNTTPVVKKSTRRKGKRGR